MAQKLALYGLVILLGLGITATAREGMWMPHQLKAHEQQLRELGLEQSVEELASLEGPVLSSIASLSMGCSSSVVSPKGLVATNHHCLQVILPKVRKKDENLNEAGFTAHKTADERPIPELSVKFTRGIFEVTDQVEKALAKHGDLAKALNEVQKACGEKNPKYSCEVKSAYRGAKYFAHQFLVFEDIRLVHVPHHDVGFFGGDVDNFNYPRTAGDWGFIRIYVGPDGRPAKFHQDNKPYRPKHYIKVNPKGLKGIEGEFVMSAGYPWHMSRLMSPFELDRYFKSTLLSTIEGMKRFVSKLDLVLAKAKRDSNLELLDHTHSLRSRFMNGVQAYESGLSGAKDVNLVVSRFEMAEKLREFVFNNPSKDPKLSAGHFDSVLYDLIKLMESSEHEEIDQFTKLAHHPLATPKYLQIAQALARAVDEAKGPLKEQNELVERLKKDFVDKKFEDLELGKWMFLLEYYRDLTGESPFDGQEQNLGELAKKSYETTTLADANRRLELLELPIEKLKQNKDPFIRLAFVLLDLRKQTEQRQVQFKAKAAALDTQYTRFLLYFNPLLADEANASLRVSFGTVLGYRERNTGFPYGPYTTAQTLLGKHTGKDPFKLPKEFLELLQKGDWGPFGNDGGQLPVNFLTDLDSIGGSSGSPTFDKNGHLVGLLFDGTQDSTIGTWGFHPNGRAIHVDVRYLLWALKYFYNASHLLEEMQVNLD